MNNELEIVQRLYELTKSNEKVWSRTSLVSQFSVESGKGRINFIYNDPELANGEYIPPIYRILILNDRHEVLESIDVEEDKKYTLLYQRMEKLWLEIQDKYYKKSETLASIKEDLGLI